jgi:hypothetical protein
MPGKLIGGQQLRSRRARFIQGADGLGLVVA